MLKFNVPKMTCGHCASTISTAIKSVDQHANIDIDLKNQQVSIESSADAASISEVLEEAGYPNELA